MGILDRIRHGRRRYGTVNGVQRTIHDTTTLDIEVDPTGEVVAVWFRCQPLPFRQTAPDPARADEMRRMYLDQPAPALHAVEVDDL